MAELRRASLVIDARTYRIKVVLNNYDEGDIYVYADEDPTPIGP
jgi:hypothetical protein